MNLLRFLVLMCFPLGAAPLLVISVDGLDHRYLRDCDSLGLRIPVLRSLMKQGELTEGIVGVVPTVTWPSHTTMITGVTPAQHGILGNRRPPSEGGDYYWDSSLLKAKTLWHSMHNAGRKTAAITWPVTVGAAIDYNLPEKFGARNGGGMDLRSIAQSATPGLVEDITGKYPSFHQQWMNDRTRTLAAKFILERHKPELLLLHYVDLDSEAHENGPFSKEANAVLEYTDELIGELIRAAPKGTVIAVVSDHGFERIDRVVTAPANTEYRYGLLYTNDAEQAAKLRTNPANFGLGREVPSSEYLTLAPALRTAQAAFEPAEHTALTTSPGTRTRQHGGDHGLWPNREDYMATMLLAGPGIKPGRRPKASMLTMAPRFAQILGVDFRP